MCADKPATYKDAYQDSIEFLSRIIATDRINANISTPHNTLASLAFFAFLNKINNAYDLCLSEQKISALPEVEQPIYQRMLANALLNKTRGIHKTEIAKIVIAAKISNGINCRIIANQHGIDRESDQNKIEMRFVSGPGKQRVLNGKKCEHVVRDSGISSFKAKKTLDLFLVNGPAGERVRRQEKCNDVASIYGFSTLAAQNQLELCSVQGIEKNRIEHFDDIAPLASELGIYSRIGNNALINALLNGKGKSLINQDKACRVVAKELGLDESSHIPYINFLEKLAIAGQAGKRVEAGERCDIVAKYYDIRNTKNQMLLEIRAVNGIAGEKVRKGENRTLVVQQHGIKSVEAKSILEQLTQNTNK